MKSNVSIYLYNKVSEFLSSSKNTWTIAQLWITYCLKEHVALEVSSSFSMYVDFQCFKYSMHPY